MHWVLQLGDESDSVGLPLRVLIVEGLLDSIELAVDLSELTGVSLDPSFLSAVEHHVDLSVAHEIHLVLDVLLSENVSLLYPQTFRGTQEQCQH